MKIHYEAIKIENMFALQLTLSFLTGLLLMLVSR